MICDAINAPSPRNRLKSGISAEVRELSPSRLAATLVVNGKTLPEHKFAVMDSSLSPEAVERFAHSLALAAADAAKR